MQWQAMWYSGAFGTTFRSVSGSLVEVIQFGFWNREPGPDFVHASIRIDGGQILEGDVEFDMHVADWERHGHSQNPAFDGTILHLFLHKGSASHFTRTTANREVPQIHLRSEVELTELLSRRLRTLVAVVHPLNSCHPGQLTISSKQLPTCECRRRRINFNVLPLLTVWMRQSFRRSRSRLATNSTRFRSSSWPNGPI